MKVTQLPYKNFKLCIFNKSDNEDYSFIKNHCNEIFSILNESYKQLGGCFIYNSPDKMLKMVARYKIIYDNDNNIFGVATYRNFKQTNSYKCILIGRNYQLNAADGKEAVKWIIKSDIINWKKLYWIEAFDAVGHWEEKYGAYKIPAVYVPGILGNAGIQLDNNDEYTYYRLIQGHTEMKPKMLFGFDSKERIKQMLNDEMYFEYDNYIRDLYAGKVDDSIYESHITTDRLEAVLNTLYFIEDRYTEQMQFRNITKTTLKLMSNVIAEGRKLAKTRLMSKGQKEELLDLCDLCEEIINNANILTIKKLKWT